MQQLNDVETFNNAQCHVFISVSISLLSRLPKQLVCRDAKAGLQALYENELALPMVSYESYLEGVGVVREGRRGRRSTERL